MEVLKKILAALVLAGCAVANASAADAYPARPVRIIVASAPGGTVDVVTRLVAQKMSETLGQPVIVENRPGADTLLGVRAVKAAAPDGYTLLATSNTITSQPSVKLDPGYDLMKDFTGIGALVRTPWVMVVGPGQPDRTVADFVARAKAHPQDMSFASGGVGTTPHLAAESFLQRAGVKLLHVPFKGNGAAMPEVISGRVTMIFEGVSSGAGKVRAGQLRALGVSSTQRLAAFPEIPTIAEQGMPGFSSYVYVLLLAPAGTPKPAIDRLAGALHAATTSKEIRERFDADGSEAVPFTPEEMRGYLSQELLQMGKLASELGLQKQ